MLNQALSSQKLWCWWHQSFCGDRAWFNLVNFSESSIVHNISPPSSQCSNHILEAEVFFSWQPCMKETCRTYCVLCVGWGKIAMLPTWCNVQNVSLKMMENVRVSGKLVCVLVRGRCGNIMTIWHIPAYFFHVLPNWICNTLNTLRPRQHGRHFPDDIFRCIFLNEYVWISIKISLKFVPKGPINNIPALVQIMAVNNSGYVSQHHHVEEPFCAEYINVFSK